MKRIIFWIGFLVVLSLIIWGLVAANNKTTSNLPKLGAPAPITAADHVKGPANAPVTLLEYSDFQCPACEAFEPLIEKLLADASTSQSFKLVYRHFPLPQHANAMISAQASEAAALQGKFWEMHDMLFANHTEWTELPDPRSVFYGYATKIGLDLTKFKTDLESAAVKKTITDDVTEGESIQISYTPTFFINGKVIENPQGYDAFKAVIQRAASKR